MRIEGGTVTATGGSKAPGIGATYAEHKLFMKMGFDLTITGGTIDATGWNNTRYLDIGLEDTSETFSSVDISGGSVCARKVQNASHDGKELHRVEVVFQGSPADPAQVSDLKFSNEAMKYGMKDVHTIYTGRIYPWVPNDDTTSLQQATVAGKIYTGDIKCSSSEGTMSPQQGIDPAEATTTVTKLTGKKGGKVLVKWKKTEDISGYQVRCSTDRSFSKNVKTKKAGSKATSATLKNLKKGKTYYIQVRSFTKVPGDDGKTSIIYGKAANTKKITIRK